MVPPLTLHNSLSSGPLVKQSCSESTMKIGNGRQRWAGFILVGTAQSSAAWWIADGAWEERPAWPPADTQHGVRVSRKSCGKDQGGSAGRDETAAGLPNRWKMASWPTVHYSKEMQKWKLIDRFLHGDNDFSICTTCMGQGLESLLLKSL